ncbi:MAG: tetratricopeptide repeat protein, partial [Nitrospinales bacterium]
NPDANMHNEQGITHFNEGHMDIALKHFQEAGAVDSSIGEIHFNIAVTLDKMGDHGGASMHFKEAKEHANGNPKILESTILSSHL